MGKRLRRVLLENDGRVTTPFLGSYASSMFAIEALSDALRRELLRWDL